MKKNLILSLLLFAGICVQPALAAGKRIDNVLPKVTVVGTPEIAAQIRGAAPKRPRPITPGEPAPIWLEFESDFDSADEFPELLFRYSILMKVGNGLKLLEGEVTHIDVARGKDRHSVMYVAPKTLNKIADGKQFNPTNIQAYWVEVFAGAESIGGQFKSSHGITYDQVAKEKDKLEKVSDAFLSKAQTPFAPLFWDYYEAVKPSGR
jgi:hypothetical protein